MNIHSNANEHGFLIDPGHQAAVDRKPRYSLPLRKV